MRFWRLSTTQVRLARHFMAPSYVLAIDQGTTSTRAILFDKDGQARERTLRQAECCDVLPHDRCHINCSVR